MTLPSWAIPVIVTSSILLLVIIITIVIVIVVIGNQNIKLASSGDIITLTSTTGGVLGKSSNTDTTSQRIETYKFNVYKIKNTVKQDKSLLLKKYNLAPTGTPIHFNDNVIFILNTTTTNPPSSSPSCLDIGGNYSSLIIRPNPGQCTPFTLKKNTNKNTNTSSFTLNPFTTVNSGPMVYLQSVYTKPCSKSTTTYPCTIDQNILFPQQNNGYCTCPVNISKEINTYVSTKGVIASFQFNLSTTD